MPLESMVKFNFFSEIVNFYGDSNSRHNLSIIIKTFKKYDLETYTM